MASSWASSRRGERQARLWAVHGDRQPLRGAHGRGVPGKAGHEPLVAGGAVELEEKNAHLSLRACSQLGDRTQGAGDRPLGIEPLFLEIPLRGARMENGREQRLRDGIVEFACDAVALRDRPVALPLLRLLELRDRTLPLADERPDEQRRERGDGDVELRAQRLVVDRLPEERAELVRRERDGRPGREHDRERCPGGAEAQCGPDQRGEDEVGDRLVGGDRRARSEPPRSG